MLLSGAEVEPKTAKPARDPLLGGAGNRVRGAENDNGLVAATCDRRRGEAEEP